MDSERREELRAAIERWRFNCQVNPDHAATTAQEVMPLLVDRLEAVELAFATLIRRCEIHGRLIGFHGVMLDEAKAVLKPSEGKVGK